VLKIRRVIIIKSVLSLSYRESGVTRTNISQILPHNMAKNSWRRYAMKKLRYSHHVYTPESYSELCLKAVSTIVLICGLDQYCVHVFHAQDTLKLTEPSMN